MGQRYGRELRGLPRVQNDGNVVVYSASGAALWSTGTAGK